MRGWSLDPWSSETEPAGHLCPGELQSAGDYERTTILGAKCFDELR